MVFKLGLEDQKTSTPSKRRQCTSRPLEYNHHHDLLDASGWFDRVHQYEGLPSSAASGGGQ
jgi:hypothetical protein